MIKSAKITKPTNVQMAFSWVYAVTWGSKTHKAIVIDRMVPAREALEYVAPVSAVYDGELLRRSLARLYTTTWKTTPVLGVFASSEEAMSYADKVTAMAEHKTKLHYPTPEFLAHVGRKVYTDLRRGLWTKPFPTWKEYIAGKNKA